MKKQLVLAPILLACFLLSCANLISNSYKSLAISKTTYDTVMLVTADLQKQGLIDQTKRDIINLAARRFKAAHNVAVDALEVYAKTGSAASKDKLLTAISNAASKWADVAILINAIKPGRVTEKFGM